jgi:hypothetical protein
MAVEAIRNSLKKEIDMLPEESLLYVQDFIIYQKYRKILQMSDFEYLRSIPGMMESISEGCQTPINECIPIEDIWPDV